MIYDLGPRARRVYDSLRGQFLQGALPPGSRLPSHTALATTFHVAPLTVRQVLSRLEDEGWVSRQQGRGTFVCQPPAEPAGLPAAWPLEWLEQMEDVAVVFGPDGQVRYWNPRATARLGPPVDTGHGLRADHVYPTYLWERWQSAAPAPPHPQDWRWQGVDPTGAALWLEGRLYPLHDPAGQLDSILCLGRDVTQYKQEEQAQTASDPAPASGYSAIDLPMGLLIVGPRADVLQCNAVAGEYLNLPLDQIYGKTLPQLLSNVIYEDGTPMSSSGGPIAQALISGCPVHNVVLGLWQADTAEHRWVLLNADPQLGPDGVTRQVICTAIDITQHRRAQRRLDQRNQDFKTLVENTPDIITRFDRQLRHVYVNPAVTAATGLSPTAFIGKTHAEVGIPPLLSTAWKEQLTQVFNTGQSAVTEFTVATPTGPAHYQTRIVPEFAADGNIEFVLTSAHDITARKQAEEALRASEERVNKIFRASPDTIAILRLADGRLIDVNESWLQAFGYRRDEVVGQVVPGLILTEDEVERMRLAQLLRENGAVRDQEVSSRRKNGEIRQFSLAIEQIDLAGEACLLVTGRDITERKEAWAAQRRADERFARVFRSSPFAIAISRMSDTVLLEANDPWLTMMGYRWEEAVGQPTRDMRLWADPGDRDQILSDLRAQSAVHERELRFRHRSGEIRPGIFSFEVMELEGEAYLLTMARDITERQQAEAALRRSEERFATAFRASPMGIGISRVSDGQIIDVNDHWVQLTGYSREEAIGQRGTSLHLWASPADRQRIMAPLAEQGTLHELETTFRRKNGSIYHASVSAEVIEIEGEPCILMISRDITAEKQAQDALRHSEERFAKVFQSSPIGIAISRQTDGVFIEVNDTLLAMTGYRRDEVVGKTTRDLNIWADQTEQQELITIIREQGSIHLREVQYRCKDGEIRHSLVSAEPIEIDGEPCLLSTIQDITERKRADVALHRSEERFATVFRTSPDAIAITHVTDGLIVDVNESWSRLFGYARDETIGQTSTALNLWVDLQDRARLVTMAEQGPGVRDYLMTLRRRDGQLIQSSMSLEIIDIEGERCLLYMIRDISERQQMEERAHTAERLGALGRVAAGVAHEFNNVLAGIMGRLDLIMTENRDASFNAQLRLIQQSAEDGAAVVARIGRFARVQGIVRSLIPVQELINDVISLTEPRRRTMPGPHSKPITIYTRIPPDLMIQGNPTELREVMTNLIFNAVDAMPQGGQISIVVGTQGDQVIIMIQDEGSGIDPAIQARIFEPFFTTKVTGSGLGLALVKNIIEAHGGTISVVSHAGQGTRFSIKLPAALPPPVLALAPVAAPVNHPARILIVDDDRRLCEMLQIMLVRAGHEVVVETSGVEAVARLDSGPFDLVCTDLGMPGMNGWEVAEQVRRRAPGTRIALITGWGNQLDPADLAQHQIDFVLPKPYRSAQVQKLVIQALTLGPRPIAPAKEES